MISIQITKSNKTFGDYAMFITFPYSEYVVGIIKSCNDRVWDKDTKVWEVGMTELDRLLKKLYEYDIRIEYDIQPVETKKELAPLPKGFAFKTTPFQHQIDAVQYAMCHDKWFLGDEMGLGKSFTALNTAIAHKKKNGIKGCLILCGVNSLKWNWYNEVQKHTNEKAKILGYRGKAQISNNDKWADIDNIGNDDTFFYITNIETLRAELCFVTIRKQIKAGNIEFIILDEAHVVRNPSTQQGKALLKLQAPYMLAMTGTPLMNSPIDLYPIFKWLGFENHSYTAFKNHFCVFGGYGGYEVLGYKNTAQIEYILTKMMLRRRKEELLDLPEKTYIDELIEMYPKQAQIYKDVKHEVMDNLKVIMESANPLTMLTRLRQVTGNPLIVSDVKESVKYDRMVELVDEAVSNNQKVVIFSNWTSVVQPAYTLLLTKYKGMIVTGEQSVDNRQKSVDTFQNDPECKFIIGTVGAMGTGLTLTEGTVEIFLDEPFTMAAKEQCVDRCHRIGQKNNITIYTLLCKDTIDIKIHKLIDTKGKLSDAIIDKNVMAKTEIISYLLD